MHLQIKSVVTTSGGGSGGAMLTQDPESWVTTVQAGRLARLLEILAQDRRDDPADGHGPFSLVSATGHAIETTGEFGFSVWAPDDDETVGDEEHAAALRRIKGEFPESRIVHRLHRDLPDKAGSLYRLIAELAGDGLIIDEVAIGVAYERDGEMFVPVQVHALRTL
jgi:hypothetical protein